MAVNWVARTKRGDYVRFESKPIYNEALDCWGSPNNLPCLLYREDEYPYPPITFEESPKRIIFSHYPYFHFDKYSEE